MNRILLSLLLGAVILFKPAISMQNGIAAEDDSRLVIAYSNNVEGYIEPCG
ncbi:MAG TPA: hypothetical protein VJ373_06365 [Desulfatiglandales bacterium]|nr:hypothetical protein [Desulfatiglandales bacterium]